MEVELLAQREFYILSISIYKVLQLDDENRNVDMKLFLEGIIKINTKKFTARFERGGYF